MSGKRNEKRSSKCSESQPEDLASYYNLSETTPTTNDADGASNNVVTNVNEGRNQPPNSSLRGFIWKPLEYPVEKPSPVFRPSRNNSEDVNFLPGPELPFAVPIDEEMPRLTAKECPILIRPKSQERHGHAYSYSNRKRNTRTASLLYYTSMENADHSRDYNLSRKKIYQSRKFPQWAWRLLSRSLGIKVNPGDTPLIGTLLHMATLMFSFMFCVTGAWYIILDVRSNYTRTTVLIGSISVVIGFAWVAIGVYANKLAARLISNKNFGENVRMHSRTIFKVSAAGILIFLSLVLLCVNIYHTYSQFQTHPCQQVGIDNALCLVNMVGKTGFGVLALIWNCLVGFVLLSVCRTHTIGIRRFIRELEADGQTYELYWKSLAAMPGTKHVDIDNIQAGVGSESGEPYVWYDGYQSDDDSSYCGPNSVYSPKFSIPCQDDATTSTEYTEQNLNSNATENPSNIEQTSSAFVHKRSLNSVSSKSADPPLMSNNDLLLSYWKISWRMRVTSLYLQRWLASWIVFIVVWCGNYIVFWMSNEATLLGIVEFILPLLMLLLICSAYAEANAEGQRMIRCICPTEERIFLLLFLNQQHLQMTVFNFALTYNAVVGVVLAFSVAFASKVVMDEIVK